ncbi:MAG TPA: MerR family transcriptional regulator [Mycobacterium sp.]
MNRNRKRSGARSVDHSVSVDADWHLPRWTVGAVAERVGVPTATLRSWNQRYSVGPALHRPGRHRLYSESDIAVVQHMHALIDQGANPRSAARTALENAVPPHAETAALLAAVYAFDVVAAGRILDEHVRHFGVLDTWDALVRPVFGTIEQQQTDGERCVDVEHALSWTVSRCFQRLPIVKPDQKPSIVLACTEHESHTMPLEALRAALGECEVGAVMLGATVPCDAILDALARLATPSAVVLWSQTAATADTETAEAILDAAATAILAGPGWSSAELAPAAVPVTSLSDALQALTA